MPTLSRGVPGWGGWTRTLPEEPAGGGVAEGHSARAGFHLWSWCWENHDHPLSQLKDECPVSRRRGGSEGGHSRGRRGNFGKGWPGWDQRVYLSRHQKDFKGHHLSLKLSSVHSPGHGFRGLGGPLRGAREFLLPPIRPSPLPELARRLPHLFHPLWPTCVHADEMPPPCCCSSSGQRGGRSGFGLLSSPILGPHWSAFPRSLPDPASSCCAVGKPHGAAQRTRSSSSAPMSQSLHNHNHSWASVWDPFPATTGDLALAPLGISSSPPPPPRSCLRSLPFPAQYPARWPPPWAGLFFQPWPGLCGLPRVTPRGNREYRCGSCNPGTPSGPACSLCCRRRCRRRRL